MKIELIEAKEYKPIKNLKITNLGDIVIIAGANGSGKTRLKEAIVKTFQGTPLLGLRVKATRQEEREAFGDEIIEATQGQRNTLLNQYMSSRRFGRGRYVGSLVQIDSERNIQTTTYNQISWQVSDPDDEETPSNFYYQNFTNRWQNFMNYIHQKVAAYQNKLATAVLSGSSETADQIKLQFPHPLQKYKDIFTQLLPDKELQEINPANPEEFKYKDREGAILPFSSLSSGEQEVVKVIFDVARKDIKHSVIILDEPELHLHPTLTFKLIETLKSIGDHTNQYIFLTHSADLISTYYSTGNVYFIDFEQTGANQAHQLSELNRSHSELVKLMGENLGIFAVGKKLIFIEGEQASIDQLAYNAIAQRFLPEARVVSVGSVDNLVTLSSFEEQIRNTIFGIDLYMIRDRDGLSDDQIGLLERSGRLRCLKKRHLENYFLDAEILYKVAEKLYIIDARTEVTQEFIRQKIEEIAMSSLNLNLLQNTKEYLGLNFRFNVPTVKAIDEKEIRVIKKELLSNVQLSLSSLSVNLDPTKLRKWIDDEEKRLEQTLHDGSWKDEFQGKYIFAQICGDILHEDQIKVRHAFVDIALEEKPEVFSDIKEIFESFK